LKGSIGSGSAFVSQKEQECELRKIRETVKEVCSDIEGENMVGKMCEIGFISLVPEHEF
jgi:hypothetical protein